MGLAIDPHEHLVQMPAPTRILLLLNAPLSDLRCEHQTEPIPPEPHRLVADVYATFEQEVLNLAQRQRIPGHNGGHIRELRQPAAVMGARQADEFRLPPGGMKTRYLLCRDDYYFVYPTKLREYQNRYRDNFLHGGVSPEEMILPVAYLRPK